MAYFANGSAGEVLDAQCMDCLITIEKPCPVAFVQAIYNYDQLKPGNEDLQKAMDMLIKDGRCLMKQQIDKSLTKATK